MDLIVYSEIGEVAPRKEHEKSSNLYILIIYDVGFREEQGPVF